MGILGGLGKTFLPIGWLGGEVDDLKNHNKTIVDSIKRLFVKPTPERQENFEAAMTRLGLTNEEVAKIARSYRLYAFLFLLLAVILFIYAFYLLFAAFTVTGWLISLAAMTYCLAQAFRFDFWAYQIKVRKLGVSFQEWKQSLLGSKGTAP